MLFGMSCILALYFFYFQSMSVGVGECSSRGVSTGVVDQEVSDVGKEPAHVQQECVVAVDRAAGTQEHILTVR
jgi:hypothetical protein